MGRETAYDNVFHAQSHFRSVLESMSRPGTISALEAVDCTPSPGLNRASVLIAMALLNADVTFAVIGMNETDADYLTLNTRARPAAIEKATFIFADGDASPAVLEGANCGTLSYPDTSATFVIQVAALSTLPLPHAAAVGSAAGRMSPTLKLRLNGPGIETSADVYVRGLNPDLLVALQARNAEFPLGIDAIVTCDHSHEPRVLGLPRTTRVSWDAC